jgi:hypothetical protein
MNQALLTALEKVNVKDAGLREKIAQLKELTYEEDGSLKGKLIMNVQPSVDEEENVEVLKLPQEVITQ